MITREATVSDLLGLLEAQEQLRLPKKQYARLLAQVSVSDAYAVYAGPDDPLPLAIAGLAPISALDNQAAELWFGVRGGGVGRHLVAMAFKARSILRARAADYPGGIFCLVRDDNPAGQRLSRLVGLRPQPVIFKGHREWTLEGRNELSRQDVQPRRHRTRTADRATETAS